MARRWTRGIGDRLISEGPCLLHCLLFEAGDSDRYIDVYDGRDKDSGKLFSRHKMTFEETHCDSFDGGVPFATGIYIDAESSEEKITIVFEPLPK